MLRLPRLPLSNLGMRTRHWLTVGISCLPPNRYRSIFVLGYPRTGTNWLCTMLNHYFEIPMSEPWLRKLPAVEPVILHLHRFTIVPKRTIYMIRDPRDIVISQYHKILAEPDSEARTLAARFCEAPMLHENLRVNLPGYIRFLFEEVLPGSISLDRHFRKARLLGLYTARYEDMLDRGEATLTGIVEFLSRNPADPQRVRDTLERTSFESHTGRKRGEEDVGAAVARKGIAGDWKNQFTSEAARSFDRLAGEVLIESGYETDHGWIDQVVETDGL